ncbi:MAG: hypothetical protein IPL32_03555 [Chloracidobacterium sp.]|nr:hypothetical protein [Chloracidobacterium sp.]
MHSPYSFEEIQVNLAQQPERWVRQPGNDRSLRDLLKLKSQLELLNLARVEQLFQTVAPQLCTLDSFRALQSVCELQTESIITVLSHPVSTCWLYRAAELLHAADLEALPQHLDGFAPLAIACFAAARVDCVISDIMLPAKFSFPGFALMINLDRPTRVRLEVKNSSEVGLLRLTCESLEFETPIRCDTPETDLTQQHRIIGFPRFFEKRLTFEYGEPLLCDLFRADHTCYSDVDLKLWSRGLRRSESLLERRWPEMYNELSTNLRVLTPTSTAVTKHHSTGSNRTAAGAICTTLTYEPWFTDGLIHEHRHDLLNKLMLIDGIFEDETSNSLIYYSPWRPDPRPAIGLFHALYVFIAVAAFYERLLTAKEKDIDITTEDLLEAFGLQVLRLLIAVDELRGSTNFTRFGNDLLMVLDKETVRLHTVALETGAFRSGLAAELARDHFQKWTKGNGIDVTTEVPQNVSKWAGI